MEPLLEGLEKTSYHERNTRVKVFGHGFKKSDILNEALNQARVEETGLRIPKLLEVRKVDGKWASDVPVPMRLPLPPSLPGDILPRRTAISTLRNWGKWSTI